MDSDIAVRTLPLSERIAHGVSRWTLVIALVVFLLPFVTVSCATPAGHGSVGAGVTARYSGLTLAISGDPMLEAAENVPSPGPPTADDRVPPQPLFTLALALTAAALIVALRGRKRRALAVTVTSGAAAASAIAGLAVVDRWLTDRIVAALRSAAEPGSPRPTPRPTSTRISALWPFSFLWWPQMP